MVCLELSKTRLKKVKKKSKQGALTHSTTDNPGKRLDCCEKCLLYSFSQKLNLVEISGRILLQMPAI